MGSSSVEARGVGWRMERDEGWRVGELGGRERVFGGREGGRRGSFRREGGEGGREGGRGGGGGGGGGREEGEFHSVSLRSISSFESEDPGRHYCIDLSLVFYVIISHVIIEKQVNLKVIIFFDQNVHKRKSVDSVEMSSPNPMQFRLISAPRPPPRTTRSRWTGATPLHTPHQPRPPAIAPPYTPTPPPGLRPITYMH